MLLPLPTVFDGAGEIDEPTNRNLIQLYLGTGIDALFVLGSYGQGPAMRRDQRRRMAEIVFEEVRGRVPVVVHIGAVDPYTSIELGQHARTLGADAVAMVGPFYYSDRTRDELAWHFQMVDEAVQLPLFLYNNPDYQGYPIGPEFAERLAEMIPRVFGVKLALGTLEEAMGFLAVLPNLAVFATAGVMVPGVEQGIRGTVSPPLTLAPELGVALFRAIDEGRREDALEIQEHVGTFSAVVIRLWKQYGRSVHREGLRALGIDVKEFPRWPTAPLPEGEREVLIEAMNRARAQTRTGAGAALSTAT